MCLTDNRLSMNQQVPRSVSLIGAAQCWGARDPHCAAGPQAVRNTGLDERLRAAGYESQWKVLEQPHQEPVGGLAALPVIAEFCRDLAREVGAAVAQHRLFAVFGGDHSCAIGTWSGVRSAIGGGPLGLLWIDAHMDSHTPQTTHSGSIHGMPLAALLGHGDPALTGIGSACAKLHPDYVSVVGVRSFEEEEAQLLSRLGVRVYHMDEVHRRGLTAVMDEAMGRARAASGGWGVTIDLDAVDPQHAPGVGTPEPGGIDGDQLIRALQAYRSDPALLGVEIVELNPKHDVNERTAQLAADLMFALI